MVGNHIKTETELFAKADEQRRAGKKYLANFVMSHSTKQLGDLLSNTWKMQAASSKIARRAVTRMDVIREGSQGCMEGRM